MPIESKAHAESNLSYNDNMHELPIKQVLPDIQTLLSQNNRLILQAPPGAGKTTMVPLALLNQDWLGDQQIIMLEPRRLATRNAAARMADMLGETVGETVGYQIRQDKKISDKTRILVVTEGILTRMLQTDPELEGVALVIFDEFHERNLHADLSLAFCLQSQELLNEQLKILLMSATLNTQALTELLTTPDGQPQVVTSQGRSYPIEIIYHHANKQAINHRNLTHIVSQQTIHALDEHDGNLLIFLPGVREIKQIEQSLHSLLNEQTQQSIIIAPLYGDLTKAQQDQAITAPPAGHRKIVLATNIAETSLTIEGITVVIDSGLQRESRFNPASGMNSLHTTMIARDSADQRSGRAGRLSAGTCYRLWHESQQKHLSACQSAEILRSDLAPTMLELAQWGIHDVNELQWLDSPPSGHTAQARDLLQSLLAIEPNGQITKHGQHILKLGLHPRLAHMILMAQKLKSDELVEMACRLAALITEKDIIANAAERPVDISFRLSILEQIKRKETLSAPCIDMKQCHRVLRSAREFQQRLKSFANVQHTDNSLFSSADMAGVLLAYAYPDRIAQRRNNKDNRYLLSNGKGAVFLHQDVLGNETYLVIANLHEQKNLQLQKKEAHIFLAAAISKKQIEIYFDNMIIKQDRITWDSQNQKVNCLKRTSLGHLTLTEQVSTTHEMAQIHRALLDGIKTLGINCLPWTKPAINLRQRIEFLNYQQQKTSNCVPLLQSLTLPNFCDESLLEDLEQWLLPHLTQENSIRQLQNLNLETILRSSLTWESQQAINELAPEKIQVPSGSEIRIDYSEPQAPFLAVRLQELFGLQKTPTILEDCYPLLLHLLSPAFRPMQVTQDLASFWQNTYNDVKKELRGKYKKHYWPDDPLQAQATNRAKPRKP